MSFRVVCIAGPDGSNMHAIGAGVASQLGFTVVDEAIVTRAAAEAGVDPHVVEDVEKRQTFMARLLDALSSSSDATAHAFGGGVTVFSPTEIPMTEELRGLIRSAIEETSTRGDVVIVAHAASYALVDQPDVLRVLITASDETRRARLAERDDLDEEEAAQAADESIANRADYLKRFYGVKEELPTHYDLIVNTDRVSTNDAVALISRAAAVA